MPYAGLVSNKSADPPVVSPSGECALLCSVIQRTGLPRTRMIFGQLPVFHVNLVPHLILSSYFSFGYFASEPQSQCRICCSEGPEGIPHDANLGSPAHVTPYPSARLGELARAGSEMFPRTSFFLIRQFWIRNANTLAKILISCFSGVLANWSLPSSLNVSVETLPLRSILPFRAFALTRRDLVP
ncbi:uncharacterized protein EI90DRAFT_3016513 [Cantharellus anzutake]|uniref:uncharacterized protein n=1 Tax=Cantharellus anzutake TaxID=1750568 RepID=UPI001904211B|nr:uncharacterized protein EI90DRAFT_3016513 [Cantharellus anzutake]KAF8331066.1 hypothetical protein EI90DRAFT_3016513 [Cantharellus anzutake]